MSIMMVTVVLLMTVVALMEDEGQHTQETEFGVHLYSHCLLSSGPLPAQIKKKKSAQIQTTAANQGDFYKANFMITEGMTFLPVMTLVSQVS